MAAVLGLAGLAAVPAAAAPDCAPPLGTLTYRVLNDDVPVGEIEIAIDGAGGDRDIRASVDVELSLLGVIGLRYRHHSQELWRGGRFQSFRGRTDDIGKRYEVAIETRGGEMHMTRNGAPRNAEGPLMTWAVWCEAALREDRVVDPLKGKLKGIEATFLGTETVDLGGHEVPGRRWRVVRKKTEGDVWYGPAGIVVKARFPTAIGTTGTAILMSHNMLPASARNFD